MASENSETKLPVTESVVANEASASKRRRRRKWDQPADTLLSDGIVPFSNLGSFLGFKPPAIAPIPCHVVQTAVGVPQAKLQDELIAREVVINDAEASVRYKLTKRQTQVEIQNCTGATVITRGKYHPPNAVPDNEKPLYLHISAGAHFKGMTDKIIAVDRAVTIVEDMLRLDNGLQAATTSHALGMPIKALNTCVFVGFDTDPSTKIAACIRGPNDQYINHIMNETGASVLLRGQNSGNVESPQNEEEKPLHLLISSNNPKSLEDARLLAENLLDTISLECGATRIPSLKVHNAVPPPPQISHSYLCCSSGLRVNTGISSFQGISTVGSLWNPLPSSTSRPGDSAIFPSQTVASPGGVQHVQYSLPIGTSYNDYGGIYPQATPLQQVALALEQSSYPMVSTVVSPDSQSSMQLYSGTSSTAEVDHKPPRRRKFQELPAASEGSTKEYKGECLRRSEAEKNANHLSMMPSPKKLVKLSSKKMPPPPPRNMPQPPKFTSSNPNSEVPGKNTVPSPPELVPETLVKLMEYGDDTGDNEPDSDKSICESTQSKPETSTPKPFWAL